MKASKTISTLFILVTLFAIFIIHKESTQQGIFGTIDSYKPIYATIEKSRDSKLKAIENSIYECASKYLYDNCINSIEKSKKEINNNYDEMRKRTTTLLISDIKDIFTITK